jgi:hypothetical protein
MSEQTVTFALHIINRMVLYNGVGGCLLRGTTLFLMRGADKSLVRPGRKQATVTEDFEFHVKYL